MSFNTEILLLKFGCKLLLTKIELKIIHNDNTKAIFLFLINENSFDNMVYKTKYYFMEINKKNK